jgi:hypothetical protein
LELQDLPADLGAQAVLSTTIGRTAFDSSVQENPTELLEPWRVVFPGAVKSTAVRQWFKL